MKEEVFIPSPLAQQLEEMAVLLGVTADELAKNAIINYLRSESNGR